MTQAVTLKIES